MALTNYTTLQAAIASWLNRSDLTAQIPDFITLAEDDLARSEALQFEVFNTITLQAAQHVLPTDVREITSLYLDDGVRQQPIDIISPEAIPVKRTQLGQTGFPRFAAVIKNGTELLLVPTPDQAYVATIQYHLKLPRLGASQAQNWVLDDHSDVYLYGSLIHSAPFLKDDNRMLMWEDRYEKAKASLDAFIERRRWSGNTLLRRPPRAIG